MGNGEWAMASCLEHWLLSDNKRIRLLARFSGSRQYLEWASEYALMATQWFYTERGEQRGPVGFEDLKSRAERGSLRADDLVGGEGMPQWKPASQVDGLFASPRPAPPPLPGQSTDGPPYESWDADYRTGSPETVESESRQWAMFLHFS